MLDLRAHFSRFLGADPGRLHAAAHSHHPWPDVTREAQLTAWDDAARLQDGKWEHVLGPVWQAAQRHRPSTPSCHRQTTGLDSPERRMISVVPHPSAVATITQARARASAGCCDRRRSLPGECDLAG
jgi:hypothetical protein